MSDEEPVERYFTIMASWGLIAICLAFAVLLAVTQWPVGKSMCAALGAAVPGILFGLFLAYRIHRKYTAWIREIDSR